MAAKASESRQGPQLKWLDKAFGELWRDRAKLDKARGKFEPKPKRKKQRR